MKPKVTKRNLWIHMNNPGEQLAQVFWPKHCSEAPLQLSFGCSRLAGSLGKKDSIVAVEFAIEQGVRYFDVARSYGYGGAESLLGKILKSKREQIWISSKFGIEPPPARNWRTYSLPLARRLLKWLPGLRRSVQKVAGSSFSRRKITAAYAQSSLETSLREINTDYLDLYLLHDASASDFQDNDELLTALDKCKRAGKCRFVGITAGPEKESNFSALFGANGVLDVFQTSGSLVNQTAFSFQAPKLRIFHSALQAAKIFEQSEFRDDSVALSIQWMFSALPSSILVVGMNSKRHIEIAVDAAKRGALSPAVLHRIDELVKNYGH